MRRERFLLCTLLHASSCNKKGTKGCFDSEMIQSRPLRIIHILNQSVLNCAAVCQGFYESDSKITLGFSLRVSADGLVPLPRCPLSCSLLGYQERVLRTPSGDTTGVALQEGRFVSILDNRRQRWFATGSEPRNREQLSCRKE